MIKTMIQQLKSTKQHKYLKEPGPLARVVEVKRGKRWFEDLGTIIYCNSAYEKTGNENQFQTKSNASNEKDLI